MSCDRHAPELCRLSAEVVSVRVSGWRTAWVAAALSTVGQRLLYHQYNRLQLYMYSYEESAVPL